MRGGDELLGLYPPFRVCAWGFSQATTDMALCGLEYVGFGVDCWWDATTAFFLAVFWWAKFGPNGRLALEFVFQVRANLRM